MPLNDARLSRPVRIVVAGSRSYNDYTQFCELMSSYMWKYGRFEKDQILFITGRAKRGPDDMIVRWCQDNDYEWSDFYADWDAYGKSAGYIRNAEMAKVATHVLVFWDRISRGSKNMIDLAMKEKARIKTTVFVVEPDKT